MDTPDGEITEKVGSMVVATGAVPLIPEGIFGYGKDKGVITLMELEQALKKDSLADKGFSGKSMVFIQCAGARTAKKEYCSRICCMTAVKNAMAVKKKYPPGRCEGPVPGHADVRHPQGADALGCPWARGPV